MENLRKSLVNNEQDFLKYTSRPTNITHKIFSKNYATIHEIKLALTFNKPIGFTVGFTVLELSKWLMYVFHYVKNALMLNCHLLTQADLLTK